MKLIHSGKTFKKWLCHKTFNTLTFFILFIYIYIHLKLKILMLLKENINIGINIIMKMISMNFLMDIAYCNRSLKTFHIDHQVVLWSSVVLGGLPLSRNHFHSFLSAGSQFDHKSLKCWRESKTFISADMELFQNRVLHLHLCILTLLTNAGML